MGRQSKYEIEVLRFICNNPPPLSWSEIYTKLEIAKSTLSYTLNSLEKKGFIKREVTNNRKVYYPTEKGRMTLWLLENYPQDIPRESWLDIAEMGTYLLHEYDEGRWLKWIFYFDNQRSIFWNSRLLAEKLRERGEARGRLFLSYISDLAAWSVLDILYTLKTAKDEDAVIEEIENVIYGYVKDLLPRVFIHEVSKIVVDVAMRVPDVSDQETLKSISRRILKELFLKRKASDSR